MRKAALSLTLCMALVLTGCSTTWVTTLDNILVAAAPALIDILNIISIAQGTVANTNLESKITVDAATIKTLSLDFADASAAAAPGACSQLQAAIQTYSSDEAQVVSLANISNPATQAKVATLSALVAGTISAILAVIPNCQQAAAMRASLAGRSVPIPLKSFVRSFNETLVVPTGVYGVDAYTKSHKVHVHNKVWRVLTLGMSY